MKIKHRSSIKNQLRLEIDIINIKHKRNCSKIRNSGGVYVAMGSYTFKEVFSRKKR
jgi:hypothetical protein